MSVVGESTPHRRSGREKSEMRNRAQATHEARQEDREWGQQETRRRVRKLSPSSAPLCWPRSVSRNWVCSPYPDGETDRLVCG